MKRIRLAGVAGASAVLYTAVIVVVTFLVAGLGVLDAANSNDVLPLMAEYRTRTIIAGWLLVAAPVFQAVAGLGFLETLRPAGSMMCAAALGFIGGSFLYVERRERAAEPCCSNTNGSPSAKIHDAMITGRPKSWHESGKGCST